VKTKLKLGELRIGNQVYRLTPVPDLLDLNGNPMFGESNFEKQVIQYDSNRGDKMVEETLFHEVLEVIKNNLSGFRFSELQMDVLARHIVQVIDQFGCKLTETEEDTTNA
jgi:hypothetical protein